jgi:hypothetical protein
VIFITAKFRVRSEDAEQQDDWSLLGELAVDPHK